MYEDSLMAVVDRINREHDIFLAMTGPAEKMMEICRPAQKVLEMVTTIESCERSLHFQVETALADFQSVGKTQELHDLILSMSSGAQFALLNAHQQVAGALNMNPAAYQVHEPVGYVPGLYGSPVEDGPIEDVTTEKQDIVVRGFAD